MRALLAIVGLCFHLPKPASDEVEAARVARADHYRSVLSAISAENITERILAVHDLPDGLRQAIEAWTSDKHAGEALL